jgi:hypothetical protein
MAWHGRLRPSAASPRYRRFISGCMILVPDPVNQKLDLNPSGVQLVAVNHMIPTPRKVPQPHSLPTKGRVQSMVGKGDFRKLPPYAPNFLLANNTVRLPRKSSFLCVIGSISPRALIEIQGTWLIFG